MKMNYTFPLDVPDFRDEKARKEWMTTNAEYFTTIRRQNRRNIRSEHPTLEAAKAHAGRIVRLDSSAQLLIYAVVGPWSAYVTTVKRGQL
jgi:hypothetical protein